MFLSHRSLQPAFLSPAHLIRGLLSGLAAKLGSIKLRWARIPRGNTPEENVRDARDGIYRDGGQQSMLALSKTAIGYTGALTLGVKVW